jgi:hypothetical protein
MAHQVCDAESVARVSHMYDPNLRVPSPTYAPVKLFIPLDTHRALPTCCIRHAAESVWMSENLQLDPLAPSCWQSSVRILNLSPRHSSSIALEDLWDLLPFSRFSILPLRYTPRVGHLTPTPGQEKLVHLYPKYWPRRGNGGLNIHCLY